MSGSSAIGGGIAEYGVLGRLVGDSAQVRSRLDALTRQETTGKIADTYAGLGTGAATSLDLSPAIGNQKTWQANIDASTGRMQVTQSALQQVQDIASTLYAQLDSLNGVNATTVDSVAAAARQALQQVAGALDSTNGGTYVFAGQDSANPPVPDPDQILTSGFYTQINAAVAGLGASASVVTGATLGIAASNAAGTSPFSATQSQAAATIPRAAVSVGPSQAVQVGLLASANSFVISGGASTTGSYMRDVMRALATIGSLSSSQTSAGGFAGLIQDTRVSLGDAITAMGEDAGVLGDTQTQLATTRSNLATTQTALAAQVSDAEDVDMASTLSQITLTQTQLQASYQLISGINSLSLAKYLTAG